MRVIEDYKLSRAVIASHAFKAYPMADRYRELEARLGRDFGSSIELLEAMPIFVDGALHKARRKLFSRRLSLFKQVQLDAASEFGSEFSATTLQPGRAFDLLIEFARPLFHRLVRVCVPESSIQEEVIEVIEDIPLLFSPVTPLKQRIELNKRLAKLTASAEPDLIQDIALLSIGLRPLTGSLALSLHAIFSAQRGVVMSEMQWPDELPCSALHDVDRIAMYQLTLGQDEFFADERVRCPVYSQKWSDRERTAMMFGAGTHRCLGQSLSEKLWRLTVEIFAGCKLLVEVRPLEFVGDHQPFHLPSKCQIELRSPSRTQENRAGG